MAARGKAETTAEVYSDGALVRRSILPSTANTASSPAAAGIILTVSGGKIAVTSASCPTQDCVLSRPQRTTVRPSSACRTASSCSSARRPSWMPCSPSPADILRNFLQTSPALHRVAPAAQRHRPGDTHADKRPAPAPADAALHRAPSGARSSRRSVPAPLPERAASLISATRVCSGSSPASHAAHDDIPVRHHPAQPPVPAAHRQRADVVLRQEPRRHGDAFLRRKWQ